MRSQRQYAIFALLTLAVCTLALYIYRHRQGRTGYMDNILISFTASVQKQFFYFVRGTDSLFDQYIWLVDTKKQNEELTREIAYLKTKVTALGEIEKENERFRKALDFRKEVDMRLLSAHVIAHDVSSDHFGVRIDRGSDHGVEEGLGVIAPSGLVGRVFRVTPSYSDVLTLIDPTSSIDVVVQRSRARGILSGQGGQLTAKLGYIDKLDDVQINDVVVASGFGDIFPKGLLVGHVTAVIPNPSSVLQSVTVKSAVNIYRLEEVFIVFSPNRAKKAAE